MSAPAMSRLLGQIREIYDDPIFVRSSRRLIPTPFAESMRQRLRALATEAENLVQPLAHRSHDGTADDPASWAGAPVIDAAPLATRPSILLEGEPPPEVFARKLAALGHAEDTRKQLAKHIATIGGGIGHSRPLTIGEAEDALSIVLDGGADPAQVGALLSVMNFRGETAAELAGLVRAARAHIRVADSEASPVSLDWPSYISPKSRKMPWFLQAALVLAQAGHRILLHGIDGGGGTRGKLVSAVQAIGIPVCTSLASAREAISACGIAYVPVGAMSSQLHRLQMLYGLFETRSPINSLMPLLNPLGAPSIMMGVVRPAYRELHRDAGGLLGFGNVTIFGASRDAAEAAPFRSSTLLRLVDGRSEDLFVPASPEPQAYPMTGISGLEYWRGIWTGSLRDERAADIICSTVSIALLMLAGAGAERLDECRQAARKLWDGRRRDIVQIDLSQSDEAVP